MKHPASLLSIVAAAAALVSVPAFAQSQAELAKELKALMVRVQELEQKLQAQSAAPAQIAPTQAAGSIDPSDFNRIAVKAEALEDAQEANGYKLLKINGMIDPTYIYNANRRAGGFSFLGNFDGRDSNEYYSYDNSYFGMAVLDLQKEMDSGTKWRLTLVPHKSAGSGFNLGSIVHEASVSIPLTDSQTRLIGGMIPDWTGYEYFMPNQNKLITHNLLFDFLVPTYYTGAGIELTRDKWLIKGLIANMNRSNLTTGTRAPILTYRVDYAKGEFDGFGFTGQHGLQDGNRIDMLELDGYFTRGPLTLQGQVSAGRWRNMAANGGDARWAGVSGLAGYKLTPRLEVVARADHIWNRANGGGVFGDLPCPSGDAQTCLNGDYPGVGRNGFGPSFAFNSGTGNWEVGDPNRGNNRMALTLGANYLLNQNATIKAEYRYDRSTGATFMKEDGSFTKDNHLLGLSTVVQF